jgi:FKBP-type peptidyl-prolyl cis-trans isomerase (trigger factor)
LQLELNRTLQELDDARAERVSDKKQIADLQKDVQRQQQQQQQQQQQAVVAMRSEDKEVKVQGIGSKICNKMINLPMIGVKRWDKIM